LQVARRGLDSSGARPGDVQVRSVEQIRADRSLAPIIGDSRALRERAMKFDQAARLLRSKARPAIPQVACYL
jgi:hypothetical protein